MSDLQKHPLEYGRPPRRPKVPAWEFGVGVALWLLLALGLLVVVVRFKYYQNDLTFWDM